MLQIQMSPSLEEKLQERGEARAECRSDGAARAIASKWMSHFVFTPQTGGHFAKIDRHTLGPGNMLVNNR